MRSSLPLIALAALFLGGCFRVEVPADVPPASSGADLGEDRGDASTADTPTTADMMGEPDLPLCGDGVVQDFEECDPAIQGAAEGACPVGCNDDDACTFDTLQGAASTCDAVCSFAPVDTCTDDDGCCPAGCTRVEDTDCPSVCGDGIHSGTETCDPAIAAGEAGACPAPTDCPAMACTTTSVSGTPAACDVECQYTAIVACIDGDGCCPSGCNVAQDNDCAPSCGNGVVDANETCDPAATCPTNCNDGVACTVDNRLGNAATCDAACLHAPIARCIFAADGCCPQGCTSATDSDCVACSADGQCGALEHCNGVSCIEAVACGDARDPDAWCVATSEDSVCDAATNTCYSACGVATDCPRVDDSCAAGRCAPASTCSTAANPDQWCVNVGAGDVCLADECAFRCSTACDCPLRHLQACEDVLGTLVCRDASSCADVCTGFEDLNCAVSTGAGSTCDTGTCLAP